ncbi:MAG: ABC transporter permease subunit [Flavonifractor plautii]
MYSASLQLFLIFLLVTVVALIFTKKSNACRNIYYVGSNENAAKLSGINVDRVKIFVYVVIACSQHWPVSFLSHASMLPPLSCPRARKPPLSLPRSSAAPP